MYKKILVPVDGSNTASRGLQEAIGLAKDQDAVLRVIHVVDQAVLAQTPGVMMAAGDVLERLEESGAAVLKRAVALAARAGVKADTVLLRSMAGRIADGVIREAQRWRADLIVMGTHGRRGISRMLLGSDAETVVRSATVPVMLVGTTARKKRPAARKTPR